MKEHFKNLHHAYLIVGDREEVEPLVLDAVRGWGVETRGNPDFCVIEADIFKIEDARALKSLASERGITRSRKVFVVSVNNILHEAQNTLLKLFEEPVPETHFFLVLPETANLLPTFTSRFYLIRHESESVGKSAKEFASMTRRARLDFIKKLLEDENETRARAAQFLNGLEAYLHIRVEVAGADIFAQIFRAREYLAMPGTSAKNLLESVALSIPEKMVE
ncbi:MAG: hypothetical protein AAB500_02720 [Patescibacteria group bacterium]